MIEQNIMAMTELATTSRDQGDLVFADAS